MEKTITLGNKNVKLRSTAATPLIYKNQFKRDFFSDMLKLASGLEGVNTDDKGELDISSIDESTIENFDLTVLYNSVWALAKNEDLRIGEPIEFFSQFESMNIAELFPQIQDLLFDSIQTTKK